ncbi:MAG: haloalkane dehalogenase [Roseiarcus sp.]
MAPRPDAIDLHPRKRVAALDTELSFVDTGVGDPIVFLHGNPTSSYLWRNIIPHVRELGRCLAPDLVGMGQSGPSPAHDYRFVDHARYLDAWFEALELQRDVTLVLHDWGSALGFYWARRHPERVRAIAYMEAIVCPRNWDELPKERVQLFRDLRSPNGEQMIFDQNFFIEALLPKLILRRLSEAEMEAYRRPFRERAARLPTLVWPRELPIGGEPADVVDIVNDYGRWLSTVNFPKLFVSAEPGAMLIGAGRAFCRTWPNQEEITVPGIHFIQEDSPGAIGSALAGFVRRTRRARH